MTGESSRFTSDRRKSGDASWKTAGDWKAGLAENVQIVDGGLVSRGASQYVGAAGQVLLTGTWDAGVKPTTTPDLVDGDPESGVTDGRLHDNNYQIGSVSAQIVVQYETLQAARDIAYDLQISHIGSGWNSFGHSLNVSDGTNWERIASWSGGSGRNVSSQNAAMLPFDQIRGVELDIVVNGGRLSSEEITAFIDFYDFQLLE